MAEKSGHKQSAISPKVKMELLNAVDEKGRSKTDISKEFQIANSILSTIIKNRDQQQCLSAVCLSQIGNK